MYVCICHAVTERDIDEAVKNGAKSLRDLRNDLHLCTECGLCAEHARACLKTSEQLTAVQLHHDELIPMAVADQRLLPVFV